MHEKVACRTFFGRADFLFPTVVRDPGALRYGSMSWRRARLAAEYGLCLDRPVTPVS